MFFRIYLTYLVFIPVPLT
uniref:Uncharacterized protein n=1 Tax=Anguilla anguilla TaxID=7936 RepID=A0A0E9RNZ5_ANGAN